MLKKLKFLLLFCLLSNGLFAQPFTQLNQSTKKFPDVELQFHNRNPQSLKKENVKLFDGDAEVTFEIKELSDSVFTKGKDILILFENSFWPEYEASRTYFKELLKSSLKKGFQKGDRFYIAEYDWDTDGEILKWRNQPKSGYKNVDSLLNAIDQIDFPYYITEKSRKHHSTELHRAMVAGCNWLKEKKGGAKAVFVFSQENNNIFNTQVTQENVIINSREKDIPLYCVRYPFVAEKYSEKRVADETYGLHTNANLTDFESTVKEVTEMFLSVQKRSVGKRYELALKVDHTADGNEHDLYLKVSGAEQFKLNYSSPGLIANILKNPIYLIPICLVIIGLIVFLVIRYKKSQRTQLEEKARQERMIAETKNQNEQAIRAQEENFRRTLREKEEAEKRMQQEQAIRLQQAETYNRMRNLPRKAFLLDQYGNHYNLNAVVCNIGRGDTSTIVLNDADVSRNHAAIGFESGPSGMSFAFSGNYYLWDNGSTNGTYVNERILAKPNEPGYGPVILKHNDVLRFGKIMLTFNC